MLTVIVDFDGSGKTRTCRPLASLYSVMPSTDVTRVMPAGNVCATLAAAHKTTLHVVQRAATTVRFISSLLLAKIRLLQKIGCLRNTCPRARVVLRLARAGAAHAADDI